MKYQTYFTFIMEGAIHVTTGAMISAPVKITCYLHCVKKSSFHAKAHLFFFGVYKIMLIKGCLEPSDGIFSILSFSR